MRRNIITGARRWLAAILCLCVLVPSTAVFVTAEGGTEHQLDDGTFNLSAELTIDGKEPDENTVIHDGTKFSIRLSWTLPPSAEYTPGDTFTYTLPDAIPETTNEGKELGSFQIDGRKVTVRYNETFLSQGDRSG